MVALLLFGLIATAYAAPQFDFGPPLWSPISFPNYPIRAHPYIKENVFDTEKFWDDLPKHLKELDFSHRFPTNLSSEGIEGNEYKIRISLPEVEKKDIVVKSREGLLMVHANHKYTGDREKNYLDVRMLPDTVNVTGGNWIFEKEVLKITFPLKEGANVLPTPNPTQTPTSTEE